MPFSKIMCACTTIDLISHNDQTTLVERTVLSVLLYAFETLVLIIFKNNSQPTSWPSLFSPTFSTFKPSRRFVHLLIYKNFRFAYLLQPSSRILILSYFNCCNLLAYFRSYLLVITIRHHIFTVPHRLLCNSNYNTANN